MKVLHLLHSYLPVTENWLFHLLDNTSTAEHHVAARTFIQNEFRSKKFKFIEHHIQELLPKYQKSQRFYKFFNGLKWWAKNNLIGDYNQHLSRYCRKNDIEIVHAHFADVAWYHKSLWQKLNLPLIVSFYGWDYQKLIHDQPEYKDHYKKIFSRATYVLAEGKKGRDTLVNLGCPKDKAIIQPLGVNISKRVKTKTKKQGELHLVQISSLTEKKGQDTAIDAYLLAKESCPTLKFTLIGNSRTEYGDAVLSRINNTNDPDLLWKPSIAFSELNNELLLYDVLIQPSQFAKDGDCEGGAPVILLNAQNQGLPVLSTSHCDIPDQVKHEYSGLLSPEKDTETLAKNIEKLYRVTPAQYENMSTNAYSFVRTNYNIVSSAAHLDQIYRRILSL